MSEAVQSWRRSGRMRVAVATVLAAGGMTLLASALTAGAMVLVGFVVADAAWHRPWVDQRLAAGLAWLGGMPLVGPLAGVLDRIQGWLPQTGPMRDMLAFSLVFFPLMLVPGRLLGQHWGARFDAEALRPWPPDEAGLSWAGPLGDAQQTAWHQVHAWCQAGAGSGRVPLWRPWALPEVAQRFSVAVLTGSNGVGKSHLAEAVGRDVVQRRAWAETGRRRWAWLQVVADAVLWWRPRAAYVAWNSGCLVDEPAVRARLAVFSPRRPTFMVADELPPAALMDAIERLGAQRAGFRHPVRLLIIDTVLPGSLGLRWQAGSPAWTTAVHELGEVPVIDMSLARLAPVHLRRMASVQRDKTGQPLVLPGLDAAWQPLVDAVDGLPVLVAEAVQQVKEGHATFDSLMLDGLSPDEAFAQDAEAHVLLPADLYGKVWALPRTRLLGARARQREESIRVALGAQQPAGEALYYALLVATLAGGAPVARLCRLFNWPVDPLGPARLAQLFGHGAGAHAVPAIKPTVVADELIRRYFNPGGEAVLPAAARDVFARAWQQAWLLNPAGALRTAARWRVHRGHDPLAQALAALPLFTPGDALPDLPGISEPWLRVQVAVCYAELAVLHAGDVDVAQQALSLLDDAELTQAVPALEALFDRPDVYGLPALILWLSLTVRRWPMLVRGDAAQVRARALAWLARVQRLIQQADRRVQAHEVLAPALFQAWSAVLARVSELAPLCAEDEAFREAVAACSGQGISEHGALGEVADQVACCLGAALCEHQGPLPGEPAAWAQCLMHVMARFSQPFAHESVGLGMWLARGDAQPRDEDAVWGECRALRMLAGLKSGASAEVVSAVMQRLDRLRLAHPGHVGIQEAIAGVWCNLAWMGVAAADAPAGAVVRRAVDEVSAISAAFPTHVGIQDVYVSVQSASARWLRGSDVRAAAHAVERMLEKAQQFPEHDGMQLACVQMGAMLVETQHLSDALTTAQWVAAMGSARPAHGGIQYSVARAWAGLVQVYGPDERAQARAAAERVAAVADAFPGYVSIQYECARAWRLWVQDSGDDWDAALAVVQRVADVAHAFPDHQAIHDEYARAWSALAHAGMSRDVDKVRRAARQVTAIVRAFPDHVEMQVLSSATWCCVARTLISASSTALTDAVGRCAAVTARFPGHRNAAHAGAAAWMCQAVACRRSGQAEQALFAAERAAEIGGRFASDEGIQHACVLAWSEVAYAYVDHDAATARWAAEQATQIADRFSGDVDMQYQCAQAWCSVAMAYRHHDVVATAQAVERAAAVALVAPDDEPTQFAAAQAWTTLVEAAMRAGEYAQAVRALRALDALVGVLTQQAAVDGVGGGPTDSARLFKERAYAYAIYNAWQATGVLPD